VLSRHKSKNDSSVVVIFARRMDLPKTTIVVSNASLTYVQNVPKCVNISLSKNGILIILIRKLVESKTNQSYKQKLLQNFNQMMMEKHRLSNSLGRWISGLKHMVLQTNIPQVHTLSLLIKNRIQHAIRAIAWNSADPKTIS